MFKKLVTKNKYLYNLASFLYLKVNSITKSFKDSSNYWERRYQSGKNSGAGSYSKLADFKANIINSFVLEHNTTHVIEFGCGDGNQLKLANYPEYLGFDVSETAIKICKESFVGEPNKNFKLVSNYAGETADLTLSLDVIYHLVEEAVFSSYMNMLFDAATKYVIIYSSNTNISPDRFTAPHVKHREFTAWVQEHKKDWTLIDFIPNKYPYNRDSELGSFADFYIYERA